MGLNDADFYPHPAVASVPAFYVFVSQFRNEKAWFP